MYPDTYPREAATLLAYTRITSTGVASTEASAVQPALSMAVPRSNISSD